MKKYIVRGSNKEQLILKVAQHFKVEPKYIKYEIIKKDPEFELKVWMEKKKEESFKFEENFKNNW